MLRSILINKFKHTWNRFFVPARRKVGRATADHFWVRYSLLAPLLAARACRALFTGSTTAGSTHATINFADSIAYVSEVFADYQRISGLKDFSGRAAEIGPGDSCGIALLFLAHGCSQIDLLDRFFSPRDASRQQDINKHLVSRYPPLRDLLCDDSYAETSFRGLARYYGETAAAEVFFRENKNYNLIVSRAVFEHLFDPLSALSHAARALSPGGIMVHCVDCRDHGLFSNNFHELKFLELPEILYAPLRWRGGPNRIRLSSYVKAAKNESLSCSIFVRHMAGIKDELNQVPLEQIDAPMLEASRKFVSSIRSKLAYPFSMMSDEDLMVQGFSLRARKL